MESLFTRYEYLHAHPELSGKEENTAIYLENVLSAMGYRPMRLGKHGVCRPCDR